MNQHERCQQQKELSAKYLAIAKRQYLAPDDECALKVADIANVHVMQDGGAWVDAQVWVPKEAIE